MNNTELKQLIAECIQEVKLKRVIRGLISESIEEIKSENETSLAEYMEKLEKAVKKIDSNFTVDRDDAGHFNICHCLPHYVNVRPMYTDKYDVIYFKDGSDRTKKIGLTYDEMEKFVVDSLSDKTENYVNKAKNKVAENNTDKEGTKTEFVLNPDKPERKIEKMVTKEDELPNAPWKEVDLKNLKRKIDMEVQKVKYTYPKQKDKDITVKLKSKKQKTVSGKK